MSLGGNGQPDDPEAWRPASRRLITARIVTALAIAPVPILAGALLGLLVSPWWWLLALPFAIGLVSVLVRSRRYVASLAHQEGADELMVRSGVLMRSTTLVPYGRLQYVELVEGPIDSRFGLAQVRVHTATNSSVDIPGLPVGQARELRDRLASRCRGQETGL